jgi:hypothetical protein
MVLFYPSLTVDTLRLQPDSLRANLRSPLENKIRGQPSGSGGSSRLRLLMAGGSTLLIRASALLLAIWTSLVSNRIRTGMSILAVVHSIHGA